MARRPQSPGVIGGFGKRAIITAALLAALGGLAWVIFRSPGRASPSRIDLNLGGPPGWLVTGSYELDGVAHAFAGRTPTNLVMQGSDVVYAMQATPATNGFRVTLYVNELPKTSTLGGATGGVRGRWHQTAEQDISTAAGF